MSNLGRKLRVPREAEGLFRDLYRNPAVRVVEIMATFKMSEAVVQTTARRLGLPNRSVIRARAGLSSHGIVAKRKHGQYEMDAVGEKVSGPPMPGLRVCAHCGYREATARPHQHGAAA